MTTVVPVRRLVKVGIWQDYSSPFEQTKEQLEFEGFLNLES